MVVVVKKLKCHFFFLHNNFESVLTKINMFLVISLKMSYKMSTAFQVRIVQLLTAHRMILFLAYIFTKIYQK